MIIQTNIVQDKFLGWASIDDTARFYGPPGTIKDSLLKIGRDTRIDAFCVISVGAAGIEIGDYTHIATGVYLFGGGGKIKLGWGCFLSPGAKIFTATDDMASDGLVGTQIPTEHRKVKSGDVTIWDLAGVGTGGIVFPGVTLYCGAVVGANSIAKRDVPPGHIVAGPNQRVVGGRSVQELLRRQQEIMRL